MRSIQPVLVRGGIVLATFVAVTAILIVLVRPFDGGPASGDAASSVLYWDRIASGQHLEAFLNTTPKPLLTVAYGILHAIDPGWALVSLAAILSTALGIVLAGEVVRRVAGLLGAAFAIVALTGSVPLLANTSWGYGLGAAFAGWMAAGLMLLRPSPRYAVAGAFLALAGLVRPESYVLVAAGLGLLALARLTGRPVPRGAWLIAIGFTGLLGMGLHDWLLTGDPLWWTAVAPHAVQLNNGQSRSLLSTIRLGALLLVSQLPLAVAGTIGGLIALRRRQWVAVTGLVVLGPLTILETWALAVRHLEVIGHYLQPVTLAMILGSAIAVGTLGSNAVRWIAARARRPAVPLATGALVLVAIALGIAFVRPHAWVSRSARATIALEGELDLRAGELVPTILAAMPPPLPATGPPPGALGAGDPSLVTVYVPRHRLSRAAVDLGLPLTSIADLDAKRVDLAAGYPRAGSIVYLDTRIDPGSNVDRTAPLRVTAPTTVGGVRIVPVRVDPAAGIWIVLVMPATSADRPDVGG